MCDEETPIRARSEHVYETMPFTQMGTAYYVHSSGIVAELWSVTPPQFCTPAHACTILRMRKEVRKVGDLHSILSLSLSLSLPYSAGIDALRAFICLMMMRLMVAHCVCAAPPGG